MRMTILLCLVASLALAQAPVFEWPIPFGPTGAAYAAGTPLYRGHQLNQTNDAIESYVLMPFAMTVTGVAYRVTAVAGTAPTYRISLQGVAGNGIPDGTIKSNGNAYCDVTPTAAGLFTCDFVASYAASKNEQLAVVIAYVSGTIDSSNNATFAYTADYNPLSNRHDVNRTATVDGGSRTRRRDLPNVSLRDANGHLYPGYVTIDDDVVYRNDYEAGLSFFVPCSMASSLAVRGVEFAVNAQSSGTLTVRIYDSAGTEIASVARPHVHFGSASGYAMKSVWFPSEVSVRCGERYTVGITSSATFFSYMLAWNAVNSPWIPWRGIWWMRQRPIAGSWTDYTNLVPWAHLLVYQASVTGGFSAVSY